ncbi:hypothetical protein HQQ81_05260 [Microbacteriaceae bacterium VKM Ac-2854]|nr:hypothetical protein [Microbacteriaceae bacterium VKM Ac-2854]
MVRQRIRAVAARVGSRRSAVRPALIAAAVLVVVMLGAVVVTGLRSAPAAASTGCGPRTELLSTVSALDRSGAALIGSLSVCADASRGVVVYTNDTPVAWTVPGRGPAAGAALSGGDPSGALLSGFWQRTGRGAVLAPGASAELPSYGAPYAWSPDRRATRTLVTIGLILDGQARAAAAAERPRPSADDGVFAAAALGCAAAIADGSSALPPDPRMDVVAIRSALDLARNDVACANAWMRAGLIAREDGWTLPPLADILGTAPTDGRAAAWFGHAQGFAWHTGT